MISSKAKSLIDTLIFDAAWSVGVTSPDLKSMKELESYIQALEEGLLNVIRENDLTMPDENYQWMYSPMRRDLLSLLEKNK